MQHLALYVHHNYGLAYVTEIMGLVPGLKMLKVWLHVPARNSVAKVQFSSVQGVNSLNQNQNQVY
jgi:hypothetical protein